MKRNRLLPLLLVVGVLAGSGTASAQNVAIIEGSFYTPNLRTQLESHGFTVTNITTAYTAATLAPFQAVYHYGNSAFNDAELVAYVTAGGRLVETPWFWWNNSPSVGLQVFSNGGTAAQHTISYPGVSVLDAANPLLVGVTFPPGSGGFNIGRTSDNTFVAGSTAIANWADGTAMIGTRPLGLGTVIGINMQVITSDTAFDVIDQPWASQLLANAAGFAAVPEPSTWALLGASGLLVTGGTYYRRWKLRRRSNRR